MSQPKISARILMPVLATALSAGMSGDALATAQESTLGVPPDPAMMKLNDESAPPVRSAPSAERPNEGLMIADVIARGVHQLNGLELERFIAGKTMIVRNTVTGHRYEVFYAADGNCVVRPSMVRRREAEPVRDILSSDAPGLPSRYAVTADGKLRTMLDGRSFTVKIYKNGNTYLAIENEDFDLPTQR